jgi:hypothetical protein
MNWLDFARNRFQANAQNATAETAKRIPSSVLAVPVPAIYGLSESSNEDTQALTGPELEAMQHAFEERAAIMEFDGDLTRQEAERRARADIGHVFRRGRDPGPHEGN